MLWKARAVALVVTTALVLGLIAQAGTATRHHHSVSVHPNVIVLLLDDAVIEDIEVMPNVQSLLEAQGTTFTQAYVPEPLCCPARATILTGRYPHNHHVLDNVAPLGGFAAFDDSSTLATWLDPVYSTFLVGKYMNGMAGFSDYVAPGWDVWKTTSPGSTYDYLDPTFNVNGVTTQMSGYTTHVDGNNAVGFVRTHSDQPYFAYVSFVANHTGGPRETPDDPSSPSVEPRYQGTEPRVPSTDPSFNEADVSDKPSDVSSLPPLPADEVAFDREFTAQRREAVKTADDEIGDIVAAVTAQGDLADTYFVFASDNGMMTGQHRIRSGKGVPYQPAVHVPLVIRGPGFPAGSTYGRVVGLQDVAPTILDAANVTTSAPIDGVSLLALVTGAVAPTDRPQLIEVPMTAKISDLAADAGAVPGPAKARRLQSLSWYARGIVASSGWKYVEYPQTGEAELYNLDADPYETANLANDAQWATKVAQMSARLHTWQDCATTACR